MVRDSSFAKSRVSAMPPLIDPWGESAALNAGESRGLHGEREFLRWRSLVWGSLQRAFLFFLVTEVCKRIGTYVEEN